ncbi:hypothetical protein IWW38_003039, partial [Coemansia aciculifera]
AREHCHNAKLVKKNRTIDFRFRRLSYIELSAMQAMVENMDLPVPPIEPNLVQANLCGTCQQRLRCSVEGMKDLPASASMVAPTDFRRNRSISSCIRNSRSRAIARTTAAVENARQVTKPLHAVYNACFPPVLAKDLAPSSNAHSSQPSPLAPVHEIPSNSRQFQMYK